MTMRYVRGRYGMLVALGAWAASACDAHAGPNYAGEALASLQGRVEAKSTVSEADVGVLWLAGSADGECSGPVQSCPGQSVISTDSEANDCYEGCGESPPCAKTERVAAWEACMSDCGVEVKVEYEAEFDLCYTSAVGQIAPVTGGFPAQFTLDLLAPPPQEALLTDDAGVRAAVAYIVALEPGAEHMTLQIGAGTPPEWLLGLSETHLLVYAAGPIVDGSPWSTLLGGTFEPGYHLVEAIPAVSCAPGNGAPGVDLA